MPLITDELAQLIKAKGQRLQAKAGEMLFREGTDLFAVPLVESGRIRVFKQSSSGKEITLYDIDPGGSCVIAAGSILAGAIYPANAIAESNVVVWLLDSASVRELFDSNKAFRSWIFELVSSRIVDLMSLVDEIAFKQVDERLASYLIKEADDDGVLKVTQEKIASELGTAREVVSRVLRQFELDREVALGRGRITITDQAAILNRLNFKHLTV